MLKAAFLNAGLLLACALTAGICADADKVVFQFPEYDYKETSKNEITFREFESACDQSNRCATYEGIERTRCVRECISPSCYQEIYKFDEVYTLSGLAKRQCNPLISTFANQLEEGEIDVRLNSFRACFMQRLSRNRG
ncbi:hypothetical protein AND_009173 [Anopheles darlingi]|uniref:Uncharacterized protein n=1 Tax=Anopheles darlingi TaxID=43151 RepID=W5J491_ANODA|nr:hypothetical protein AND_009173 [Anopheles darlingi]